MCSRAPRAWGRAARGRRSPRLKGRARAFPHACRSPRGQARPGQELIQGKVHAVAAEGVQPPLGVQVEQGQPQGLAGAAKVAAVQTQSQGVGEGPGRPEEAVPVPGQKVEALDPPPLCPGQQPLGEPAQGRGQHQAGHRPGRVAGDQVGRKGSQRRVLPQQGAVLDQAFPVGPRHRRPPFCHRRTVWCTGAGTAPTARGLST